MFDKCLMPTADESNHLAASTLCPHRSVTCTLNLHYVVSFPVSPCNHQWTHKIQPALCYICPQIS